VLATRYASNLDAVFSASPVPVSPQVQEAASESLIATVGVLQHAQGLPPTLLEGFRTGAFDAFMSAAHVTTTLSLVIVVLAALLVGFGLPMVTPPSAHEAPAGPALDETDALVKEEGAAYASEAAVEYVEEEDPRD
jgi:hypothetical protein